MAQLIDEVLGLLELPLILLAELAEVGAGAAASALLALSGLARLARRFLRAGSLRASSTAAPVLRDATIPIVGMPP